MPPLLSPVRRPVDLLDELESRGLPLDPELRDGLDWPAVQAYLAFLIDNNERGGFFSKNDSDRILERHVYECAVYAIRAMPILDRVLRRPVSRETQMLDLGSGPGLPGMLFASHIRKPALTLLDSSQRRLGLLAAWLKERGNFDNVRCRFERAEDLADRYDVVLVRAVAPFPASAELACASIAIGGVLAVFHGEAPADPAIAPYLRKLGLVSRETVDLPELAFLGKRCLGIYLKERHEARGYPRSWKQIKDSISQWQK